MVVTGGEYDSKSKPIQAGASRIASRRSVQLFAIVASVFLYLLYGSPYFILYRNTDVDLSTPTERLFSPSSSASQLKTSAPLEDPEALLEPIVVPLQLQNPSFNVRVLRSILQHSNTSWQDTPGEAQGHFVQSLLWMQVVRIRRPKMLG